MKRKIYKSIARPSRKIGSATYERRDYLLLAIPALVLLIVACLISYIIMTTMTVFNTSKRASLEKQIAAKSANITDLETKLASIDKNITPVLATLKGFADVNTNSVKYITTKPIRSAMSSNEMEL